MSEAFPVLSLAERDRHWQRTRALMAQHDLACLIVFGLKGRERYDGYLSNESIDGVVVFPAEGEPIYLTWATHRITRRMADNMRNVKFWIDDMRIGPFRATIVDTLSELKLDRARIGVVGLDSQAPGEMEGLIPYRVWSTVLERMPHAVFVELSVPFSNMMLIKSDEELRLVRFAAEVGEKACKKMLEITRPGVSEAEIYAAIMDVIHRHSAISVAPHLIISVGADDIGWAPPYWNYAGGRSRVVQPGDLVQAEIFPCYGGVETQMQMSVAVEPVPHVLHELNDIARRCYDAGLTALRPGRRFREVADAMAKPLRESGCYTLTPLIHSLTPLVLVGHVGINIDKMPRLSRYRGVAMINPLNDIEIESNMTFAFEPNACRDMHRVNIGGALIVRDGDPVQLNTIPLQMNVVS